MQIAFYSISILFILINLLPLVNDTHWVFRAATFTKIHIFVIEIILLAVGLVFFLNGTILFWTLELALLIMIVYNAITLIKYTSLYPVKVEIHEDVSEQSKRVSIISSNVYQFNNEHYHLVNVIKEVQPDIVLTMESNKEWENSLSALEKYYPYRELIAQENTYGMHFYSKLKVIKLIVHYFVADDIPSIEAIVETEDGEPFKFWGLHPPPPSPTEEKTSKERDGELMSAAKKIIKDKLPVIVVGDFNNVAWGKSSRLFRSVSQLIDPRVGRALVPTFHARYKLLRIPIDMLFHSKEIFITEFKTLPSINSDHFPIYCEFFINNKSEKQEDRRGSTKSENKEEVDKIIEEGKKEESDQR